MDETGCSGTFQNLNNSIQIASSKLCISGMKEDENESILLSVLSFEYLTFVYIKPVSGLKPT